MIVLVLDLLDKVPPLAEMLDEINDTWTDKSDRGVVPGHPGCILNGERVRGILLDRLGSELRINDFRNH